MIALEPFDYAHEGQPLNGLIARPAGLGPFPAVLVMHDARGLGSVPRERLLRLAKLGYVAMASDMYGGTFYDEDPIKGGTLMWELSSQPGKLRARVIATFEALRSASGIDPDRIAAIGFCFGGQCVLELARSGSDVKAVISYHGLLTTDAPAEPGSIAGQVAIFTGGKDPYAPREHVDAFRDEMIAAGADCHITNYGNAYHSFTDPKAESSDAIPGLAYDRLADQLSWEATVSLLKAKIG